MSHWLGLDKTQTARNRPSQSATCFVDQGKLSSRGAKNRACALTAFLQILLCALAVAGDLTVPAPRLTQPSEISFRLHQGYLIIVEGRIGNLEHQNFLVDTGTSPSIIDKEVCARLGLLGVPRALSLFNKELTVETVMLPELQLGPVHRSNFPVMVEDFSKIGKEVGARIDAVIGLDVLGTMNFTLDFQKSRILFHASAERHSAPFSAGAQFITLAVKTGGKELRLLVDTGTPRLVLFREALQDLDFDRTEQGGAGENMSGTVSYKTIVLPAAHIGREEMGPQAVAVVTNQKNVGQTYDGLIGVSLFHPKQISFDFDRQILGWSN